MYPMIISVAPERLIPTQDYLYADQVDTYVQQINEQMELFPIAAVEAFDVPDTYKILDGHHRAAAYELTKTAAKLWVPQRPNAQLPLPYADDVLAADTQKLVRQRYMDAQFYEPTIEGQPIDSVKTLCKLTLPSRKITRRNVA